MAGDMRAIMWIGDAIRLIDQTVLPEETRYLDVRDVDTLVEAIRRLAVRGAPALGAAGAYGVALAMLQARRAGWDGARLQREIDRIRDARPTAANLAWAVDRVRPAMARGTGAVLAEAQSLALEDESANRAIGRHGADWILGRRPGSSGTSGTSGISGTSGSDAAPLRVLTHCNTGALATTAWGTALGVVRELHARAALGRVYVNETRPLLQGSRLTAWELARLRIPYVVQVDGAAPATILSGLVDVAVIGADRVTAGGDVANKIGSLGIALACADAGIPFVVAAPESTVDRATASGAVIPIELRDEEEVLSHAGRRVAPPGSDAYNPAFDVTPARLVTALVTELGVLEISAGQLPGTHPPSGRPLSSPPPAHPPSPARS